MFYTIRIKYRPTKLKREILDLTILDKAMLCDRDINLHMSNTPIPQI